MGDIGRILELIGGNQPIPSDQEQLLSLGGPVPPPPAPVPVEPPPTPPLPQIAPEGLSGLLEQVLRESPGQGPGMPGVQPTLGVPLTEPLAGLPELPFASPAEAGAVRRASQVSTLPPNLLAEELATTNFPSADATSTQAGLLDNFGRQPSNMRAMDEVQGIRLPEETRQESARRQLRNATSLEEPITALSGQELSTDISGRFVPIVGELLDARDAIRSFREGNFGEAGINAAAALIPLIPGSTAIRRGLSQLKPKQRVQWAEDFLRNNKPLPWVPESRGVFDRSLMNDTEFFVGDALPRFEAAKGARGLGTAEADQIARSTTARRIINLQMERGRALGGDTFYQTQPVIASIQDVAGPYSPDDVMWALAFTSPQTELPSNIANMSLLLRGTKLGLDPTDALAWRRFIAENWPDAGFQFIHSGAGGKAGAHLVGWGEYRNGGIAEVLGTQAKRGNRMKVTGFGRGLLGDWSNVAVDTHELGGATLTSNAYQRYAIAKKLRPAEYRVIENLYQKEAGRIGMHPAMFQAGRWFGGGEITGLRSPRGDFVQQAEDVLLWNANARGLDASATGLRKLWADVMRGDEVLFPPSKVVSGEGARAPYLVPGVNVDF